jgi:hypothetical protein
MRAVPPWYSARPAATSRISESCPSSCDTSITASICRRRSTCRPSTRSISRARSIRARQPGHVMVERSIDEATLSALRAATTSPPSRGRSAVRPSARPPGVSEKFDPRDYRLKLSGAAGKLPFPTRRGGIRCSTMSCRRDCQCSNGQEAADEVVAGGSPLRRRRPPRRVGRPPQGTNRFLSGSLTDWDFSTPSPAMAFVRGNAPSSHPRFQLRRSPNLPKSWMTISLTLTYKDRMDG